MILLLWCISAAVGYYAIHYAIEQRIEERDRQAFVKAWNRHGGRRQVWSGTDWSALERWGEQKRAEVERAYRSGE